ncbi:hypothetical protein [Saccharopolyspora elongata]|uniref:hypothetical protein n=1 Tax=Saccharopolyspora elongata TaxID=2530387 RepID=UPI001404341B|nr:hypothetical protein [Saccharopolyspora elongata]
MSHIEELRVRLAGIADDLYADQLAEISQRLNEISADATPHCPRHRRRQRAHCQRC